MIINHKKITNFIITPRLFIDVKYIYYILIYVDYTQLKKEIYYGEGKNRFFAT